MKNLLLVSSLILVSLLIGFWMGYNWPLTLTSSLLNPLAPQSSPTPTPLQQYSFPNLRSRTYQTSPLTVKSVLDQEKQFTSYLFSFQTMGKTMTGQLNLPLAASFNPQQPKVILMIRGYVPPESYTTGLGTKNAAAVFAQAGYVTIAPDFLDYGESDPEFSDSWEARLAKPVQTIELMKSLQANQWITDLPTITPALAKWQFQNSQFGIWAHSNGGQIALATLEVLSQPIPTTLWAPVTAPFPYSVLYYSDENEDEGKEARAWVNVFERDYDAFDFSLTQHLQWLTGPILLQHGTADDVAPRTWSDEFRDKIEIENEVRETATELTASHAAQFALTHPSLDPIDLTYKTYSGADHNFQPGWNQAVQDDLEFFAKHLP